MDFKQYLAPALVSAIVVVLVGLFVVPAVQSVWDDFAFLHFARQQAIQQQIQQQRQAAVPAPQAPPQK